MINLNLRITVIDILINEYMTSWWLAGYWKAMHPGHGCKTLNFFLRKLKSCMLFWFFLKKQRTKSHRPSSEIIALFFNNKNGHNNTEKQQEEGKCVQLLLKTGIWKSFNFI